MLYHTAGTRESQIMCCLPYRTATRAACLYFHIWPHSDFPSVQYEYCSDSDTGIQNKNLEITIKFCLANFCFLNTTNCKPHVPFEGLKQNLHGLHTHTHTHVCVCARKCMCICVCVCVCVFSLSSSLRTQGS